MFRSKSPSLRAVRLLIPTLATSALLAGCAGFQTTATPPAIASVHIGGTVVGGQQPVSGARIYLYAAGLTGYGSASKSLLGTGTSLTGLTVDGSGNSYVTSDGGGSFSISANYSCASGGANAQVYLLALGGNPGLTAGTNNSAISLIAALGACNNLTSNTFVVVNEVSTVAAVTALQQFMVDPTHIGSTPTNTVGLQNAFLSVGNVVDLASGNSRATPLSGSGSAPQLKTNLLGNILAPCVNSAAPTTAPCANLFTAATPAGSITPATVAAAMLLIAKNPGNNVAGLFQQSTAAAPFNPALVTVPNDFTLPVSFSGGGLTSPGIVVIDAGGNAWTANCPSCASIASTDSIVGFSPTGTVLSGTTGFTTNIHKPFGIAFDTLGNLWSVNQAAGASPDQVVKMNTSGTVATGFPFANANLGTPIGIAIDASSNAWVTNPSAGNILNISAIGTLLGTPYSNSGFAIPIGVGIDPSGFIFGAGEGSASILKINPTTSAKTLFFGPGLISPIGIAIDNADNIWTLNNTNSLSVIGGASGAAITANTGVGAAQAAVIAIDGFGTGWLANCRASCPSSGASPNSPDNLLHFSINGTGLTTADGFQDSHLATAGTVAIDPSGNAWVSSNTGASLVEFLGIAAPVATPLVRASSTNQLGVRP